MARILSISASPQQRSSTSALLTVVDRRLVADRHQVTTLHLRRLPPSALLAGDRSEPHIARALSDLADADAVVVATPTYQASYSGLLKVFVDVVPQFGLRGKTVLPLATGGSTAHALAVDFALRPLLSVLGARHVAPGWFVPSAHVRQWPDGGVLLDAASATPLTQVVTEFLSAVDPSGDRDDIPGRVDRPAGPPVSSVAGTDGVTVLAVGPQDPRVAPLLQDLDLEHRTRYGANRPMTPFGAGAPWGSDADFLLLVEDDQVVAGAGVRPTGRDNGAIVALWSAPRHRRRGLGRRLLAELEQDAWARGWRQLRATIGARQPEVRTLLLANGFTPLTGVGDDPTATASFAVRKTLAGCASATAPAA